MLITVNSSEHEIADGSTVEQLLLELGTKGPLAVELNRKVCPKRLHSQTQLNNNDVLEIVTIVGGG